MPGLLAALVLAAAAFGAPAAAPKPDCVYIEGGGASFYVDVETGAWRLIAGGPADYSSDRSDRLRLRGRRGQFADASGIQPPSASDGQLQGTFEVGGPGEVTFRDPTDGVDIRIADPQVRRESCN
jgi:hypothetical protein